MFLASSLLQLLLPSAAFLLSVLSEKDLLQSCETETGMAEPKHARDLDGRFVELRQSSSVRQRFHITRCTRNQTLAPCRGMHEKFRPFCITQYANQEAYGQVMGSSEGYKMMWIRVPTSCSCMVRVNPISEASISPALSDPLTDSDMML